MLDKEIQVWYTRDASVNEQRERDKARTIDWVIQEMKDGIDFEHTRKQVPAYTYTFGSVWQYVRKAMVMRHPQCAICGKPSQEIHHVRPRFLKGADVPSNLIALCYDCHDEVHRRLDEGIERAIRESIDISPVKTGRTATLDKWE